jgi:LysM repeat protein
MARRYTKVEALAEAVILRHGQGETYAEIAVSYGLEKKQLKRLLFLTHRAVSGQTVHQKIKHTQVLQVQKSSVMFHPQRTATPSKVGTLLQVITHQKSGLKVIILPKTPPQQPTMQNGLPRAIP